MQRFKIEILGACLAIATGLIVLMAMAFLAPLAELLNPDPSEQPLIHVGMTGAIYAIAILAFGIYAFWNAKWSGLGLVVCAVIGFLFGSRNPTVPVILLVSAAFCLGGWYRAARPKSETSTTP
jgi:hypothetical protein